MKKPLAIFLAVLLSATLLAACSPPQTDAIPAPPTREDDIVPTDYAKAENWITAPGETSLPVDVFYLYPTAWTREEGEEYVSTIDNASLRVGGAACVEMQASAFETAGNIFAPYYRQLDAAYLLTLPLNEQEQYIEGVPYTDAVAAFEYYLEHYNGGRPFILAGHSQGSSMLRAMLMHYMKDNPAVYERMVAAYVVGYSITRQDLDDNPHLKFAEGAGDTGVIISYNTEAAEIEGTNPVVLPGSLAINPISWTRDEELAPAEDSLGASLPLEGGGFEKVMDLADAAVDLERGTVVCSTVDPDVYSIGGLPEVFPRGVYHGQDYPFYYYDLRANAELRAENFLGQQ